MTASFGETRRGEMTGDTASATRVIDTLYRDERARVRAVCLHVAGNVHDAEDATQETFALAHRALATFRGESSLRTWVLRIAVRVALEARAQRGKRAWTELSPDLPGNSDTHAHVVAREEMNRFLRVVGTLPAEQRAVLGLSAVDGLSHAEIASVLGVAEGTVWSRLARARARLAGLLA